MCVNFDDDNNITQCNIPNDSITNTQSINCCLTSDVDIDGNECNQMNDGNDLITPNVASQVVENDSLKLMVWNINGLGDKLSREEFVKYVSNFNIVIFLETMKLDSYTPILNNFEFWHFQRKFQHARARRPAGGVGIMLKLDLIENNIVTVIKHSDFVVWLKIKQHGNLDLYLGAVYIPPLDSTSTISSFQDNNAFQLIQEDITHFKSIGHVSVCGDFNARTGQLPDYILTHGNDLHDMFVPSYRLFYENYEFPNFCRSSDDTKANRYGKELIELCKSSEMKIMNGYFNRDKTTGEFTCYTANGKSLIDYLICDVHCYHALSAFAIEPLNSDSDHRPLVFSFNVTLHKTTQQTVHNITKINDNSRDRFYRYRFNVEDAPGMITSLNGERCASHYDNFMEHIVQDNGVENVVNGVYTLLETAISQTFQRKYQKSVGDTFPKNEWFDLECKSLKRSLNDFPKHNDLNKNDNLTEYVKLKKKYRATTQKKKREYQNKIRENLNRMETTNPQEYWNYWDRLIKNNNITITGKINLASFDEYFRTIQAPPDEAKLHFDMQFLEQAEIFVENYVNNPSSDPFITDEPITIH